jgi:hypothetical protein
MVRDAALRSAFMSLFASLCGMLRVLVRPVCHQSYHQKVWLGLQDRGPLRALPIGGGLALRVSKLINVATYRHFDFGMSFDTDW